MRILCVGDIQLVPALRAIGHDIRVLGGPDLEKGGRQDSRLFFANPATARDLVKDAVAAYNPECLLVGDDSSPLLHLGLEHFELPRLWWSIDTHLHGRWHRHFAAQFHRVMGAQRPYLKKLRDISGRPAKWMPLFFPAAMPFTPWEERTIDVAFVGTLDKTKNPRRVAFLEALQKRLPVQVMQGNYRKVYRQSRIVINQAVAGDLNNRIFEAMGCGAALVTEALPQGFRDIAVPGSEFLIYPPGDVEAAAQAIESLLSDTQRCEAMARAGWEKVQSKHLASHRAALVDKLMRQVGEEAIPAHASRASAQDGTTTDWSPRQSFKATPAARDSLAYAHLLVSRLGYPEPLRRFFESEAKRRAEALVKREDADYPWSRLVLADLHVQAGQWKKAAAHLKSIEALDDPDFLEVFAPMRAVVAAQASDPVEALYWIRRGLRYAPENPILLEMEGKLRLG